METCEAPRVTNAVTIIVRSLTAVVVDPTGATTTSCSWRALLARQLVIQPDSMSAVCAYGHASGALDPGKVARAAGRDDREELVAAVGPPGRRGMHEVEGSVAAVDRTFERFHGDVRADPGFLVEGGGKKSGGPGGRVAPVVVPHPRKAEGQRRL